MPAPETPRSPFKPDAPVRPGQSMKTIRSHARQARARLRPGLFAFALAALVGGAAAGWLGPRHGWLTAELLWTAGTVPVLFVLAISILRDLLIGRAGVDAIALIAMAAAVLLSQPLAAVVIAVMYSGGTVLEGYARGRAERELRLLEDRSPRTANRIASAGVETVGASEVSPGDELLVRAGELVPVDGILADQDAHLDESAVTGEPLPALRVRGDELRSGTVNAGDTFRMRASAQAAASTYAGIVRMVAAAQTAKAPFMRMADRFALIMLPLTLAVAGAAWWASGDPVRALAVLVVATPCPLILAAPVAFLGGVSRAAKLGILMKGSGALEALANVRTVIFDKTGTLTSGGAELIEQETAPGRDPDDMLSLLASLEQASHHVLAETIVTLARKREIPLHEPRSVTEKRGSGLEGVILGKRIRLGSRAYATGRDPLPLWAEAGERRFVGHPVLRVYIAVDGLLAGVFTFGDSIRADAMEAIDLLRAGGVERLMVLTGDDQAAAEAAVGPLRPDALVADATPGKKLAVVSDEMRAGPVMMVGDGINDAPALATASVGVALGARGATASSEAADVVLLKPRLTLIPEAIAIARRTRAIAMQSIVAGLMLSGIGMAMAAFGYLDPVAGAFIQEAIDIAVILNALRAIGSGRPRPISSPVSLARVPGQF